MSRSQHNCIATNRQYTLSGMTIQLQEGASGRRGASGTVWPEARGFRAGGFSGPSETPYSRKPPARSGVAAVCGSEAPTSRTPETPLRKFMQISDDALLWKEERPDPSSTPPPDPWHGLFGIDDSQHSHPGSPVTQHSLHTDCSSHEGLSQVTVAVAVINCVCTAMHCDVHFTLTYISTRQIMANQTASHTSSLACTPPARAQGAGQDAGAPPKRPPHPQDAGAPPKLLPGQHCICKGPAPWLYQ
jgi:hypothetical protein